MDPELPGRSKVWVRVGGSFRHAWSILSARSGEEALR